MSDTSTASVLLVSRALGGEREAGRLLVETLTPSIRKSVARVLRHRRSARGGTPPEIEDLTQSVLLFLFANGGRVLLAWDPARGAGLGTFVAFVAQRRTVATLRSRRRNASHEDPTDTEALEEHATETAGPESTAISREIRAAVTDRARARLSPRGAEIFALLFLDGCSTEDVCAQKGMTRDAVYAWRSRLSQLARGIAAELGEPPDRVA